MPNCSRRALMLVLVLAVPLLLALQVNPGIFTHNHSNVNQGGASLNPDQPFTIQGTEPVQNIFIGDCGNLINASYIGFNKVCGSSALYDETKSGWLFDFDGSASSAGFGILYYPPSPGSSALIFQLTSAGVISTSSVGHASLRTATGSVTCPASSYCDIQLNDYAFFPSVQPTVTGCSNGSSAFNQYNSGVDSGSYSVPQFAINNSCGQSLAVRYRYITSTDNPRVWIVADPSGAIQSVWASDDPLPDDAPGIAVTPCIGCLTYKFGASDFFYLAALEADKYHSVAQQWIAGKGYSPQNLHYRIIQAASINLQSVTSPSSTKPRMTPDDLGSPADWIHKHAAINPSNGHLCLQTAPSC